MMMMCLCLVFWVVFLSQLNSHFLSTRRPIFIPPTCSSSSFIVSELLSQWVKKKSVRKKQYYRISHTKAHFIGLRPLYEVNFLEKKIPKALYEYYHLRDDDDSFVWLVIIVCRNVQQKKSVMWWQASNILLDFTFLPEGLCRFQLYFSS